MDNGWFLGPVHPGVSWDERSAAAAMRRALSAAISTGVEGKGARRAWQVQSCLIVCVLCVVLGLRSKRRAKNVVKEIVILNLHAFNAFKWT